MEGFMAADIFFFITAVAVVIVTVAVAVIAYHLYLVIKKIETAIDAAAKGVSFLEESIKRLSFFKRPASVRRKPRRDSSEA